MKLSFLSPNYTTHDVNGMPLRFYPVSVAIAFKMRSMAKPMAKALTTLFSRHPEDVTTSSKNFKDDATIGSEEVYSAIDPALANTRWEQSQKACEDLVEGLMAEENKLVIGEILMDSLREEFPRDKRSPGAIDEFMEVLDIATLGQLLFGLVKANKKVFGPLADRAEEMMKKTLNPTPDESSEEEKSESPAESDSSPRSSETIPISAGLNSKTE